MPKLSKRIVDQADVAEKDYFIWDSELTGFALRVYKSGRRSYLVQYRAKGRTRRFTIGSHGVWTPDTARTRAQILLGRVAQGDNPAEERQLDLKAITIKELCERYLEDAKNGLILGKKRRPKKASTIYIDEGRIRRHIVPLLGTRRVKDITTADVIRFMRDVASGKTKVDQKTCKRGRAIVRGGIGTGTRTVGMLGAVLTYARENGIIEANPAHGIRKPAYEKRTRRLSEDEYRLLGKILREVARDDQLATAAEITRTLALTGCRRGEIINLIWPEVDADGSCLRLIDSKEGASVRPIGLPVIDLLGARRPEHPAGPVFAGTIEGKPLIGFPKHWRKIVGGTPLMSITPHVLRHSYASVANDLGFTESTVAALLGHAQGTVTSRYIHNVDRALVMAADAVAGYIDGLLKGIQFKRNLYGLDRASRQAAMNRFLAEAAGPAGPATDWRPEPRVHLSAAMVEDGPAPLAAMPLAQPFSRGAGAAGNREMMANPGPSRSLGLGIVNVVVDEKRGCWPHVYGQLQGGAGGERVRGATAGQRHPENQHPTSTLIRPE